MMAPAGPASSGATCRSAWRVTISRKTRWLTRMTPPTCVSPSAAGRPSVGGGLPCGWAVAIPDAYHQPIQASVRLRLRLLSADGRSVEELGTAAGSAGATGTSRAARNVPGNALVLEATELLSGMAA